jgi:hypothetical protein
VVDVAGRHGARVVVVAHVASAEGAAVCRGAVRDATALLGARQYLGFGRIVASEIEAPNMLANMV